jgi:hypothetical protein
VLFSCALYLLYSHSLERNLNPLFFFYDPYWFLILVVAHPKTATGGTLLVALVVIVTLAVKIDSVGRTLFTCACALITAHIWTRTSGTASTTALKPIRWGKDELMAQTTCRMDLHLLAHRFSESHKPT